MNVFNHEDIYQNGITNLTKLFILLRINPSGLTYAEIKGFIPYEKSNIRKELLSPLEEAKLVYSESINHKNSTSRKEFKLTTKGEVLAGNFISKFLKDDENRVVNFIKEQKNLRHKELYKEFWKILDLFYEYGFNDNASLLLDMLKGLVFEIKKFFKNEFQFRLESKQIQT